MKKPAPVAAAEAARNSKAEELAAAEEAVQRLKREYAEAFEAVRVAQEDADSALPQCRLVSVRWRSGTEADAVRAVILRKTPGGLLVVRRVGDTSCEYRFKWREYTGSYTQAEKDSSFSGDRRELRDVPAEYLPAGHPAAAAMAPTT